MNSLIDPNDPNSLGNLQSVTEYALGKGSDAFTNHIKPNFISISLYDMNQLTQFEDRLDAYIPINKITGLKKSLIKTFIIKIPS